MFALPVLVALLPMPPHSSMKSPSNVFEHLMTAAATSVANVDALVLARILDRILLIEDEVPKGLSTLTQSQHITRLPFVERRLD